MGSESAGRRGRGRRLRWHRIYYALALFDVLVVALGILLNHLIINSQHESISTNQVWETRLDRFLDLGTVAGEVNAPGNDVFDTRDVTSESARQAEALDRFESLTDVIRMDLRSVAPKYARVLRTDLNRVEAEMGEMTAEAAQIFRYFESGRPDLAGGRMAAMDRKYHAVNLAITHTREDVGAIQRQQFAEQSGHAAMLRNFEYLIAGFVALMISCAMAYGHRIKRELETRDAERERHVAALEATGASLAEANQALTQEITARTGAESRLRLSEERYALAARGANDGLWDWSVSSGEVYWSPRWKALLGYDEHELSPRPGEWFDRVHPDDLADLHTQLEGTTADGRPFQIEHRVLHRDGGYRWMLTRGLRTRDGDGLIRLVGSHSDVTTRKQAELDLVHDSLHDSLTGLPNRVLFLERLEHVLQRARRGGQCSFAAMYVDLDRFKGINDSLGHLAGDELLVRFAGLLERIIRPGDTAARLGGDEFAVLLEDVSGDVEAIAAAERILAELREPFSLDGLDIHVSASIGIALGGTSHESTSEVLRHADAALYQAKRDGRGRYQVFATGSVERVLTDLRLEIDLRGAIAREELHVLYQPIVALESGRLAGFEALVRWNHPQHGQVPPAVFIPIAEESGDIVAIGEWVLRQACRDFRGLRPAMRGGDTLFVSVNVSTRQLLRPEFATTVNNALLDTDVSPEELRLEITESAVMRDPQQATALLRKLRDLGVRICIDDFGTGHSTLSYVHDLPVDCIKIDRSFINRLTSESNGAHIIRAILELARSTGLSVVAEGIETEDQRTALRQLDCGYGQGYFFDRPMHLSCLERVLSDEEQQAS